MNKPIKALRSAISILITLTLVVVIGVSSASANTDSSSVMGTNHSDPTENKKGDDNKDPNHANHGQIKHTELIHDAMKHNGMKHDQQSHDAKVVSAQGEHTAHKHDPVEVSDWPLIPSLTLTAHKDLMSGWNLNIVPTHFVFAPTRINTSDNPGEGHAHLYINGQKVTRVYSPWFYINNLPVGLNTITVTLNANGHGPLVHRGESIAASVEVLQE